MSVVCSARGCGVELIWTLTEAGSRMPVDAKPVAAGNIILDITLDPPRAKYLRAPERAKRIAELEAVGLEALFYVSHFASCPFADQFRKKVRT